MAWSLLGVENVAHSGGVDVTAACNPPTGANAFVVGGVYFKDNPATISATIAAGTTQSSANFSGSGTYMGHFMAWGSIATAGAASTIRILSSDRGFEEGPTVQIVWLTVDNPSDFVRHAVHANVTSTPAAPTATVNSSASDLVLSFRGRDGNSGTLGQGGWTLRGSAQTNRLDVAEVHQANSPGSATTTATMGSMPYPGMGVISIKNTGTDTTAPTLSSPSGSAVGAYAATGSVSTDEGNGTLYWITTTNTTETATAVKAGSSQPVAGLGVQNISAGGLSGSTSYRHHFLHRDASGNESTVVSSAAFTTAAPGTATQPTLLGTAVVYDGSNTVTAPAGTTAALIVLTLDASMTRGGPVTITGDIGFSNPNAFTLDANSAGFQAGIYDSWASCTAGSKTVNIDDGYVSTWYQTSGGFILFFGDVDATTMVVGRDRSSVSDYASGTITVPTEPNCSVYVVDMGIYQDNTFDTVTGWTQVGSRANTNNAAFRVRERTGTVSTPTQTASTSTQRFPSIYGVAVRVGSAAPEVPTGITYVGSATGTNTATMPAHQAGDLLMAFSYRDGNTTAPTLASGWLNVTTTSGSTNSARLALKMAASSSETVGTFTNATSTIVAVYRGVHPTEPLGGAGTVTGSSTTISYPAISPAISGSTSWVIGAAGHRSTNVAIETAPSGMTNRTSVSDATDEAAWHDTNGGVSSWTATTASVGGTSSGYAAITAELRADTAAVLSVSVAAVSGTSGTPKASTDKSSGTIYMVCVPDGDSPSVAQIKAGKDSSGGSAIAAESLTVSSIGVQTFTTVTGLTTSIPYDFWFVHTTTVGNSLAYKADFTPTGSPPAGDPSSALFWAFP